MIWTAPILNLGYSTHCIVLAWYCSGCGVPLGRMRMQSVANQTARWRKHGRESKRQNNWHGATESPVEVGDHLRSLCMFFSVKHRLQIIGKASSQAHLGQLGGDRCSSKARGDHQAPGDGAGSQEGPAVWRGLFLVLILRHIQQPLRTERNMNISTVNTILVTQNWLVPSKTFRQNTTSLVKWQKSSFIFYNEFCSQNIFCFMSSATFEPHPLLPSIPAFKGKKHTTV